MKRKLLIAIIAFAASLLVAAGTAWWYFFHTRAGVEFILARLDGLQGIHMVADEVTGNLSGPLKIKRFELDEKHAHVIVEDVELQLTPAALLAQTIRAQYLRVGRATVTIKTINEPPSTKPLRFLPLWLRVSVGRFDVTSARVLLPNGTALDATKIAVTEGVSLNSHELEVEGLSLLSPYAQVAGELSLQAKRPVGLKGHVLAITAARTPEWRVDVAVDGSIESMAVDAHLIAPNDAVIKGMLARTANVWRLTGDVTSERFALSPWVEKPPFSMEMIDLEVDASLERIVAKGSLTVPEVDSLPMQIDVTGKVDKQAVVIEQAALRLAKLDTTLNGQGKIQLGDERQIEASVRWRNLQWPLRSSPLKPSPLRSPQGSATLAGAMPYAVQTDADVQLKGDEVAHVSAAGIVSKQAVVVNRYALDALTGHAQGKGSIELTGKRGWRVETNATHINPDFFNAALPGAIDLKASAVGEGFDAHTFAVNIADLHGTLRGAKVSGRGGIGRTSDGWYAKTFAASLGDNRIALDGQFGRINNLTWRVDVPKIEQLLPEAKGELHSQGAVHGERAVPQLRGQLTAKQLRFGEWHVGALTVDADIDVTGKASSTLQADAREVGYGVFVFDTLLLNGSGTDDAHQLKLNATAPAESYESVPTVDWQAQGSYVNRTWRGTVSPLKFSDHYGRLPTLVLPDAAVTIAADNAQAQQLCLILSDRKVCADGQWQRASGWRVALASDEVELNLFDTLLGDKTQLEGRWQLSGQLAAGVNTPVIGDAHLRIVDATVLYEAIEDAQERVHVGTGRIDVTSTAEQLSTSLSLVTRDTTNIGATMQVKRVPAVSLTQSPLVATVQAYTSDANVLPLFFADLDHAAGTLRADMRATGTLAVPSITGRIELRNGEADLYRFNLALRDMGTTVDIEDNRVKFSGNGRLGKGTLNLQGDMRWQEGVAKGQLQLQGADLLVADLPEYRIVASPNLKFAVDGKRIDASGDVTIPSANLQPADLRGAVQRSPDARLVGMQPAAENSEYQVYSDISVHLGDDVQLNTFGLKGRLTGDVTTTTKPSEPARGKGELRVLSGRYQAYGQDLEIDRGRLLFEASPLDNPGLDILATRSVEEQRVGVNVRGTLRSPRLTFYSDPYLTQSETVAYLLTGRPMEDMRSQDTAAVGSATDALALQGGGLLASQLGRRIGLEQVSVESRGLDDTSLVLGKFLSPRLFVSYGISLTESINTFKARYTISDRWLLKAEAGEYQSTDVEFRIER
jgi:translocation and assembly module TamB